MHNISDVIITSPKRISIPGLSASSWRISILGLSMPMLWFESESIQFFKFAFSSARLSRGIPRILAFPDFVFGEGVRKTLELLPQYNHFPIFPSASIVTP